MKQLLLSIALAAAAVSASAAPTMLQCEGEHYQSSTGELKFPVAVDIQARSVDILGTVYHLTKVDEAYAEARMVNGQYLSLDRVSASIVLLPYIGAKKALINVNCEVAARKF